MPLSRNVTGIQRNCLIGKMINLFIYLKFLFDIRSHHVILAGLDLRDLPASVSPVWN